MKQVVFQYSFDFLFNDSLPGNMIGNRKEENWFCFKIGNYRV